jgi:prephenate dehydrogenase
MKEQILHLADDICLKNNSPKREAFIKEFESATVLMRENDWDQFYAFADIIMQKYS